jgi:hypothetical protein
MNKRIDHCLYQAGLTAQGCWEDLDTYTQEGIEKFAELVVRECADIATMNQYQPFTAGTYVLKHFGVEQ